jgi:DNA-binding CsgD family transcriptional regulator
MRRSWNLSEIGTAFAAGVKDSSKWHAAMEAVAAATRSFRAILLPVPPGKAPIIRLSESLRCHSEIDHLDGWVQYDLGHRGVSQLLRDRVVSNFDCGTPQEINCGPNYPGGLDRLKLPYFAGVKVEADDNLFCLVIQRSDRQVPFSGVELKKLANISSVLSRAASEAWKLGLARSEGALRTFSVLRWPAALLNHYGQLIQMNQNAEHLFGGNGWIRGGRIMSFTNHVTATFINELRAFIRSDLSIIFKSLMPLPWKNDGRPLLTSALRLSALSQDVFSRRKAIVRFIDLDAHPQPSESVLCRYFALSPAEARLAKRVATGKGLDILADELTITKQTARHELKSVFAKLEVHRQSELVALLSKLNTVE